MALVTIPNVFSTGTTIVAAEHNQNFSSLYNDYNGNITSANISASAAIPYSKLNLTGSIVSGDLAASLPLVPVGGIIMWSGTIAAAAALSPTWAFCNGTSNAPGPDLRDKMIVGATSDDSGVAKTNVTGSLTSTGGAATSTALINHTHTLTSRYGDNGINHGSISREGGAAESSSASGSSGTITSSPAGSGASFSIMNPYYALAFIQRMV